MADSGDPMDASESPSRRQDIVRSVDVALREVRELLHSHGRISSRNEALDEAATLLFVHAMGNARLGRGIGCESLMEMPGSGLAEQLRAFADMVLEKTLPISLAHEMGLDDFKLRIKPAEQALASGLVNVFESLPLGAPGDPLAVDFINEAFGRFLADSFSDEKELGQYLTPPEVVEFMVQLAIRSLSDEEKASLLRPARSGKFGAVLDPSCGVGSFLAEFIRSIHQDLVVPNLSQGAAASWTAAAAERLVVGIDKSERMVRLALANLALFGAPAARLHLANSLSFAGPDSDVTADLRGRVGLILTNPPFGARFATDDVPGSRLANTWASRRPATLDSELLFMERYIEWLRPGGQLLAIVPDSILTNRGLFADLRNGIAAEVDILNVISLPSVTFASAGTTTKTSVLHLRRASGPPARVTRLANCGSLGYTVASRGAQRTKVHEGTNELPALLNALTAETASPPVREMTDLTSHDRWDATFHASLSAELETLLQGSTLRIADVAALVNDRTDPRRTGEAQFRYIEISDVDGANLSVRHKYVDEQSAPSRARQLVRAGDVLVSTVRPERGTVGVVPPWLDGATCTTGFAVLRPTHVHPTLLAAALRTEFVAEQLMRHNVGIAYPAIEASCLPAVVLPLNRKTIDDLESIADSLSQASIASHQAQTALDAAMSEAMSGWLGKSPD